MGAVSALARNVGFAKGCVRMGEGGKEDDMKHRRTNLEPLEQVADKRESQDPMDRTTNVQKPEARLGREVQARIGQQLRAMYNDVVSQGVPPHLADLLKRLGDEESQ
jgi:Anti-sigma factor NepR